MVGLQYLLLVIFLALPACVSACVTRWFDRDDPTGVGDYETTVDLRREFPDGICLHPIGIEAQTLDGIPASNTGQSFNLFNPADGFACVNQDQFKMSCRDYKVRFICPPEFCSDEPIVTSCDEIGEGCTTRWFDRDNPSGKGDYELSSALQKEYPKEICDDPIAINVKTLDGIPALQTGQTFSVFDPIRGFACVNAEQKGPSKYCHDYKVQFICPKTFCKN